MKQIRGGGENETRNVVACRYRQEVDAAHDIVTQVKLRALHRLAHERVRGEVHHAVDAGMFDKDSLNIVDSLQVTLHEGSIGMNGARAALVEVVEYHHLVAGYQQLIRDYPTYVSCSPGHKYFHWRLYLQSNTHAVR